MGEQACGAGQTDSQSIHRPGGHAKHEPLCPPTPSRLRPQEARLSSHASRRLQVVDGQGMHHRLPRVCGDGRRCGRQRYQRKWTAGRCPPVSKSSEHKRSRRRSGIALLGLLLWVTLGAHLTHPLLHSLGKHSDSDLHADAGHEYAAFAVPADADCPQVASPDPGGGATEPCPVCVFVANGGPWIGAWLPAYAQPIMLDSPPRMPDNWLLPARLLVTGHSRAPPEPSSRFPGRQRAMPLTG